MTNESEQFQAAVTDAFQTPDRPTLRVRNGAGGASVEMPGKPYSPDGLPADPIMRYFGPALKPSIEQQDRMHAVRAHFAVVARWIVDTLPRCPERTVALRKLLEAKDAAVRSCFEAP